MSINFTKAVVENDVLKIALAVHDRVTMNSYFNDVTPPFYCVRYGSLEALATMIDAGVDVNASHTVDRQSVSLLAYAMVQRKIDMAQLLVDRGADVNPKTHVTPAISAIKSQHRSLVHFLQEHGLDLNAGNADGQTPLMFCCKEGYTKCGKWFIECGVDLTVTDRYGDTALHYAARHGYVEMAKSLVAAGADVKATNKVDKTPWKVTETSRKNNLFFLQMKQLLVTT